MAQLAQLLGIPEEQLLDLTLREAERIAVSLNDAVFAAVLDNKEAMRSVQEKMQSALRLKGGR
ncbi:MAG TPA: hypothetical protein VF088_18770 [Pyrinomonadaceae bacterium]